MTTVKLLIVSPCGGVGVTTFLDSLPFPKVKVPNPFDCTECTHYFALPTGDMLEVNSSRSYERETCDPCLVLWRRSIPQSEEKAREIWEGISVPKMLIENLVEGSEPSVSSFSFQDSQKCAQTVMKMVEKIKTT